MYIMYNKKSLFSNTNVNEFKQHIYHEFWASSRGDNEGAAES